MNDISYFLWLIPALPLLGFIVLGALAMAGSRTTHGVSEGIAGTLGTLFPFAAFALTVAVSWQTPIGTSWQFTLAPWIHAGIVSVNFGFLFDDLSRIMLLFITGIGTLITLYSTGYMANDRGFARFFAYLNLFLFSMVTLVISDNLVLTFLGWEGVGLCSYLLIGFWHNDGDNGKAANKAFLVNRAGDLGFLLGMFALLWVAGSSGLDYRGLVEWLHDPNHVSVIGSDYGQAWLSLAALFLFWGATAKSAQIPLLTWLPDAMAGPTPVSALIHAATMVTSGVFLVTRLSPLFVLSPTVMGLVALVGLGTALWAAIAGLFQDDIKKVLAYSTVSQLGYMFLAAGCAAFDAAIFHVFTHAFFKAALFLGAGSVIHALGGDQDMRRMGGLARKLPSTFAILAIAWMAIIGIPGFAGFWSKDLILERVYTSSPAGPVLYVVALLTAVLTAVYMTRLMVLVFAGTFRGNKHTLEHAHESPITMQFPMWVLAIGALLAGFLWAGLIPGADLFGRALAPIVGESQEFFLSGTGAHEGHHLSAWVFALLGTGAAVVGVLVAWKVFTTRIPSTEGAPAPRGFGKAWTFLFDTLHGWIAIFPARVVAWISDILVQTILIEGIQDLVGGLSSLGGRAVRTLQRPRVRVQLGISFAAMLVLTLLILRVS